MLIQAHEKLKEPLQDCRDGVIVMISVISRSSKLVWSGDDPDGGNFYYLPPGQLIYTCEGSVVTWWTLLIRIEWGCDLKVDYQGIASLQCVCLHMCCLNVICNHQATRPSFLLRISLSLLSLNQNMSLVGSLWASNEILPQWSSHHVSLTYMYCSIANHAMNIITWKKSILTSEHVTSQSIQSPPAAFISHFNSGPTLYGW